MRTPCPQVFDERITRWGFDYQDFMLLVAGFLGSLVLIPFLGLPMWLWFPLNAATFAGVYFGKRKKRPGAVLHWLHEMGLWVIGWRRGSLPGFIPARGQIYSCW
jgi:hypothetical protein